MSRILCFVFLFGCSLLSSCDGGGDKDQSGPPIPPDEMDGDPDIGDVSAPGIFYDKFEGTLNTAAWEKVKSLWGQPANVAYQHGGVIPENVSLQSGHLVLKALGDQYTGALRGVQGHSKRLGGVVKSKERFASGRYEIKMKVLQAADMGVLSAAWTFWYKDITEEQYPTQYAKAVDHGSVPVDDVITLNHEIDIEVKGKSLANPVFTNWIGIETNTYDSHHIEVTPLLDNKFHIYRWDWHTGDNEIEPRIDYYIDDVLIHTSSENVPYIASYFYVGNWFAWWAGFDDGSYAAPDFISKDMLVDWVKITPFNESNDDWFE